MSKYRTRTTKWDRLLSGVLCLALALGLLPAAGLVQTAEAAHWADPYAEQLIEWGVMSPASDLRLSDQATRAEFVAMCNRAFGFKRLGSVTFTDVPSSKWYAEDINIAYNAGYFEGHSSATAAPEEPLTREQAAVLLARIMRLQETVGESLGFTDSRELHEWSRGLIGAAVIEGMVSGYDDGSYRPFNYITRGELAAMLVRAIGTPVSRVGNHELGDVYGNVTISSSNVTLRDTVILGNLYVTGGVDLGNVLLENVTVLGRIVISGGGVSDAARSSVILRNVEAEELVIDSMINQYVTVSAYGLTDIPLTRVRSDIYLEDSCQSGHGLSRIELVGKFGTELQLAGSINEVVNMTPGSALKLVKGTAKTITIDELATNSTLLIDVNTRVDELNLDVATLVTGKGDIGKLRIWASGCEVDILPEEVEIRPGLTAIVAGKEIGSVDAAELSSEPRLMAGYPKVTGLRPTQAEGLYSGNKPGTIYWAVSEVADGSVTVEHLINNPAFGGNILKDKEQYQSGSIEAGSRIEYGRLISGMEPDVAYYISAVLVDERGIRSPLKVMSFTTPDDTVPAFTEGYPRMSKVSCETAQVTAMANKSCTLYWVLLPAGSAAPTAQSFKSGAFGGNYGSGSQSVVKNVPVSVTVNAGRLQESTYYDLYLWLNDYEGGMSSDVVHVTHESAAGTKFSFRTPDETPPVATVSQTNFDLDDAIEFNFTISEAPSTLYWAVVTESDWVFIPEDYNPSSSAIRIAVENGTKAGAIVSGSKAADGAGVPTLVEARDFANKLKYSTWHTHNFKLFYVAKDAAGNYSEVKYIIIHTKDTEEPSVTLSYTNPVSGRVGADSDLVLTFTEQVKGDSKLDSDTFVDFYNEVLEAQAAGGSALTAAKKALGDELSKHITLYYIEKNGGEPGKPVDVVDSTPIFGNSTSGDIRPSTSKYGWINWREAIVELQADGTVTLTLPAHDAVSLGSGMEYYFRFENIYDDSRNANRLWCLNNKGERNGGKGNPACNLAHFYTVYAQVLLEDRGERKETVTIKDVGPTDIYMDLIVGVTPKATSNVTDDVYWDMIIWSDTDMKVDIYYQVLRSGNESVEVPWTPLWKGVTLDGDKMKSLSENKTGEAVYETVTGVTDGSYGLKEEYTYRYGIHITNMGGSLIPRGDDAEGKRPTGWSADVNLWFSLIAGADYDVASTARLANSRYDTDVKNGTVNEIGVAYKTENGMTTEGTKLYCNRTYNDTQGPVFRPGFPRLETGSGSITLTVGLDRAGTVHYLVAPVGDIFTSIDGRTAIDETNDGSKNGAADASTGNLGKTYIPESGGDAVDKAPYIFFKTGGSNNGPGVYSNPNYIEVYRGTAGVGLGSVQFGAQQVKDRVSNIPITIKNLKPLTEYYVYIVLESDSGEYEEVVQIYRAKTKRAEPPAIEINAVGTTGATMTTVNVVDGQSTGDLYDNPELYYALWDSTALPDIFTQKIYIEDGKDASGGNVSAGDIYTPPSASAKDPANVMTVIEAMMDVTGIGLTTFDLAATDKMKLEVSQYIKGTINRDVSGKAPIYRSRSTTAYRNGIRENPWPEDFKDRMDSQTSEYYLLACAKNADAEDAGEFWGFSAARGLVNRDMEPPKLKGNPSFLPLANPSSNSAKTKWSGWLTIDFDKNVFYQPETTGNVDRYTITYKNEKDGSDGTISLMSILGGSAVLSGSAKRGTTTGNVTSSITLEITNIGENETITLFTGGWICSGNNVTTKQKLTLTFKKNITSTLLDVYEPMFEVEWG